MHPLKFEYLQLTGKTNDENLLYSCYTDLVVRLFCFVHKSHLLMSNTKPVVAAQSSITVTVYLWRMSCPSVPPLFETERNSKRRRRWFNDNIQGERKQIISFALTRQNTLIRLFSRSVAAGFKIVLLQSWIARDHVSTAKVLEQQFFFVFFFRERFHITVGR